MVRREHVGGSWAVGRGKFGRIHVGLLVGVKGIVQAIAGLKGIRHVGIHEFVVGEGLIQRLVGPLIFLEGGLIELIVCVEVGVRIECLSRLRLGRIQVGGGEGRGLEFAGTERLGIEVRIQSAVVLMWRWRRASLIIISLEGGPPSSLVGVHAEERLALT